MLLALLQQHARRTAHERPAAVLLGRLIASQAPGWSAISEITLHKKEKVLEVKFDDGVAQRFSSELLRCLSPSADNAASPRRGGRLSKAAPAVPPPGQQRVVAGRRHVGIMSVAPVGRYAIQIHFDDLHDGIYPFDFLRDLGENRLAWARHYLTLLRRAGLSRDPRQRGGRPKG